jgi:hypothetical protein
MLHRRSQIQQVFQFIIGEVQIAQQIGPAELQHAAFHKHLSHRRLRELLFTNTNTYTMGRVASSEPYETKGG